MILELDELTVLQDSLRHTAQVPTMIKYVAEGGFWTQDALRNFAIQQSLPRICPVMEIIRFPDGRLMVHDGHHRAVATKLGGRNFLRGDEYEFKNWSYDDYLLINFENRWVTPFDPRTEIRVPDFGTYKKFVLDLAAKDEAAAIAYIRANKHVYTKVRTVSGISCLTERYLCNLSESPQYRIAIDEVEYFRTST